MSTTPQEKNWQEEFDKLFTARELNYLVVKKENPDGSYHFIKAEAVKSFIHSTLQSQRIEITKDLKNICNKAKTERGLAVSLSKYIETLSKHGITLE